MNRNPSSRLRSSGESRGSTATTGQTKQPAVVLNDSDIVVHWTRVREEKNFSSDADVARFLLSWYQNGGRGAESRLGSRCSHCHNRLTLYCQTCQLSPPSKTSDSTSAALSAVTTKDCSPSPHPVVVKEEAVASTSHQGEAVDYSAFGADVADKTYYDCDDVTTHDDDDDDDASLDNCVNVNFEDDAANSATKPKTAKAKPNFVCPYCRTQFDRAIDHLNHMKHHLDLFATEEGDCYRCKHCSTTLKTFWYLSVHIRLQFGETECGVCKEAIVSKCVLARHKRLHRHEKLKSRYCGVCDETLTELSMTEFSKHIHGHDRKNVKKDKKAKESGGSFLSSDGDGDDKNDGDKSTRRNSKYYSCQYCKEVYSGTSTKAHMELHKDEFSVEENGKFKCRYCQAVLRQFRHICEHVRLEVGENACRVCGQDVISYCELSKHKHKHKMEKSRYCRWCDKSLVDLKPDQFGQHLRQHGAKEEELTVGQRKDKKLRCVCSVCGNVYTGRFNLKQHMQRVHATEALFVCDHPGCEMRFKLASDLRQHKVVHAEKKKVCEVCGMKFRRTKELSRHMQTHLGSKFECEQCGRRFKQMYELRRHVEAVHQGLRSCVCNICGRKLYNKSMLGTHVKRVHTDHRPFKCSECDAAFKSNPAMRKHMLRHSQAKPFKCVDCGVCYRDRSSFSIHRKAKHPNSVYLCSVCGAAFPIPHSLAFHLRVCHDQAMLDHDKLVPTTLPTLPTTLPTLPTHFTDKADHEALSAEWSEQLAVNSMLLA